MLEDKSTIPLLSAINPLNHLRLLSWILVTPQELKRYQEQHGKEAITQLHTWLVSTLTWLPLLLPTLALGLETLPHGPDALSATTYLWMSGGLFIAWLLTGLFGEKDDSDLPFGVALGVALGVAGVVGWARSGAPSQRDNELKTMMNNVGEVQIRV